MCNGDTPPYPVGLFVHQTRRARYVLNLMADVKVLSHETEHMHIGPRKKRHLHTDSGREKTNPPYATQEIGSFQTSHQGRKKKKILKNHRDILKYETGYSLSSNKFCRPPIHANPDRASQHPECKGPAPPYCARLTDHKSQPAR